MSQIQYTPDQRKRAYADLIEGCHDKANLASLLERAAKLYGVLKMSDLTELLTERRKIRNRRKSHYS